MNNRMSESAEIIFQETIEAMQQAEELGGCRGVVYIELMEAISREALRRAKNYATDVHRETQATFNSLVRDPADGPILRHDLSQLKPVADQFGISIAEVQRIYAYCELGR
jgi:hypothetical protein